MDSQRKEQEAVFLKDIEAVKQERPYGEFEDARRVVISRTSDELQTAISNMSRFPNGKAAWPEVVIHLAENPEEMASLNKLYGENQFAAMEELARIKAQLAPVANGAAAGFCSSRSCGSSTGSPGRRSSPDGWRERSASPRSP